MGHVWSAYSARESTRRVACSDTGVRLHFASLVLRLIVGWCEGAEGEKKSTADQYFVAMTMNSRKYPESPPHTSTLDSCRIFSACFDSVSLCLTCFHERKFSLSRRHFDSYARLIHAKTAQLLLHRPFCGFRLSKSLQKAKICKVSKSNRCGLS